MTENTDAVHSAAKLILMDYHQAQRADAGRDMTYAVYVAATPVPNDAENSVKVVEATLRDYIMAKALFHRGEEVRFAKAIKALELLEPTA